MRTRADLFHTPWRRGCWRRAAARGGTRGLHSRVSRSLMVAAGAALIPLLADALVAFRQRLQFLVRQLLNINHFVVRLCGGTYQFVELQVDSPRVAVLAVLDQEY